MQNPLLYTYRRCPYAMRARMDQYGAIVRTVSEAAGTLFVDTQTAMLALALDRNLTYIAWDRVHPSIVGHAAIARAFLDAIGFEWAGERGPTSR